MQTVNGTIEIGHLSSVSVDKLSKEAPIIRDKPNP